MFKQIFISLLISLSLIGSLAYAKYSQILRAMSEGQARVMPPDAVTTTKAELASWTVSIPTVGTLTAVKGTIVATEDQGKISKITFEPGQFVKQGQQLVELDTSIEEAELSGTIAQRDLAQTSAKRERSLNQGNANSAAQVDSAEASLRIAEANVSKLRAKISRMKISAPFAGVTGIRLVSEGEVVAPGTKIVSLQSLDSMYVNFALPQRNLDSLALGLDVIISSDSFNAQRFIAKITTIQPDIDALSRMIQVQATVSNENQKLRPGMFVNAEIMIPQKVEVLQIPTSSVLYTPYSNYVYTIEKSIDANKNEILTAKQLSVILGEQKGDMVAIISGIQAGDEIVSSGVFKLRPGASIVINNSVHPGTSLTPNPADT